MEGAGTLNLGFDLYFLIPSVGFPESGRDQLNNSALKGELKRGSRVFNPVPVGVTSMSQGGETLARPPRFGLPSWLPWCEAARRPSCGMRQRLVGRKQNCCVPICWPEGLGLSLLDSQSHLRDRDLLVHDLTGPAASHRV